MTEKNHTVNLGLIFGKNSKDLNDVVGFAINQNSNNHYKPHVEFNLFVDVISTADAFKLSRLVCNKFTRGVIAMIGDVPSDSFNTLQAYANAFEIPFVMSWFPEKVPASPENEYAVSLRPDCLQAIIDTVIYYGWKSIIYIFDSDDGLLRLQQLYRSLVPGKERFQISHVRRVSTALEVTSFLVSIERESRWSNKYVVFHCDVQLAKGAIIAHVNNFELGRRNYHYFFTELIMDEPWEKNVEAYGAINITGLRVLDPSNNLLRNFKALWQPNRTTPTTAFVYDGVQVLIDTVRRMLVKYPEFLAVSTLRNSSDSKIVDCISQTDQIPYEFGKKWSRIIKKTDLEGVTGHIHFDESGHRQNFSLQVVEMNNTGEIVQIANWHDFKGFMPLNGKLPEQKEVGYYDRSKTYVVSTILEFPFVMEEKKEYQSATPKLMGFCIDLAKLILEKMEIPSYEIRLVNDGKYGSPNPKEEGGWDGLVGELVRHEADLVIAPLVINNERQNVVDFSHPFLSYGDKTKGNIQPKVYTMFSFLTPMSLELWISIVVSVLVVSLCMTLVTKLSPHERRIVYVYDGNDSTTRAILVNEFNLRNAIWYALGAFLQQGTDLHPRSWSGRILSGVWCAFSMILVANYTANMSSNLTMARFGEPLQAYTKVTSCPKDQWTPKMQPPSEGEDGDHPSLGFIPSSYSHDEAPCELFISNSNSAVKEFAAAFPKGSKLRDGVNQALHALRAEGALQQLVRYWLINIKCTVQSEIQGRELTLSQFSGLFYTLAAGLTLGVVAGVVEFIRDRRKHAAAELPRNQDIELMPRRRQMREEPEQLGWHVRPYPQFYALQDAQEETDQQAASSRV